MHNESEDQFLAAYDKYADAIFRHCFFRLMDRDRARDLTQDVFLRTWEYIQKGTKVENIRAFLYRVANNLVIDFVRKKSAVSLDFLHEKGFDPVEGGQGNVAVAGEVGEMLRIVALIEPQYREVILMRYVEGMGPKEIAEAVQESENAVSVRLNRGIKKIRDYMRIDS